MQFSKAAKKFVVKAVPVAKKYDYIDEIISMLLSKASEKQPMVVLRPTYVKPTTLAEHHGIKRDTCPDVSKFHSRFGHR